MSFLLHVGLRHPAQRALQDVSRDRPPFVIRKELGLEVDNPSESELSLEQVGPPPSSPQQILRAGTARRRHNNTAGRADC